MTEQPTSGRESIVSQFDMDIADKIEYARHACDRGDKRQIEKILASFDCEKLVNCKDDVGWTLLHYAARGETTEHAEVMAFLIARSAEVDVPDEDCGWTALFMASQFAHTESITVLLEAGASTFLKDKQGRIAAEVANGKERRLLLEPAVERMKETTEKVVKMSLSTNTQVQHVLEAKPYVEQLEREIEHANAEVARMMAKCEDDIVQLKAQGISGYKDLMLAYSRRNSLQKDLRHIKKSETALQDLKQLLGDGMLQSALMEVKRKLAFMRQTVVANERTQAKVNKIGYRYCVDLLRDAMKDKLVDKFGQASKRQTAEQVTSTLEIPLRSGTGLTPIGFRRKLEAQIAESVERPPESKRACVCW